MFLNERMFSIVIMCDARKLQEIQLERIDDRSKKSLLHSFESTSLANLIKDVRLNFLNILLLSYRLQRSS
jgi:hypothetical protein